MSEELIQEILKYTKSEDSINFYGKAIKLLGEGIVESVQPSPFYREYVESGEVEKREEERFFKEDAYGTKEFIKELMLKGSNPIWSHGGRPKKKEKSR